MDAVIAIFKKLGVDATIFPQFIIFVAFFFILKYLFFNKLQEVLELRESKTTKLEGSADEMMNQADELEKKYKTKIDVAYQEAQSNLNEKKNEILAKEKKIIQEREAEINRDYEEQRKAFHADIASKREGVLKNADQLAGDLVEKLTN